MRLGVAAAAICLSIVGVSLADPAKAAMRKPTDIPAQSLGSALEALAKDRDIQVIYRSEVVSDRKTDGVVGEFTAEEALTKLLKGTGLSYRYLNGTTVTIEPTPAGGSQSPVVSDSSKKDVTRTEPKAERSFADRFRVAQADSNRAASAPSVDRATSPDSEKKPVELEEVVVTGTHLRGEQPAPVGFIVLDSSAIDRSGYTQIGDVLRSLPQNFGGGSSPANAPGSAPGDNETFSGGTSPNLRGLGTSSTLTLVNGQRLASETEGGGVDVSLIPLAAVDRVEVLTDGASAIYGADAVAGVVNFVLRKDYDGAQTLLSYGRATDGGAGDVRASQVLGTKWGDGGGILVYEHEKLDPVDSTQRDFTSTVLTPNTLLPPSSRDSFYLSGHQDFSSAVSAFANGLYTARSEKSLLQTYAPGLTYGTDTDVRQYMATGGLTVNLQGDWQTSLVASTSGQNDSLHQSSTVGPATDQSVQGRNTSFELSGDGTLFQAPGGNVRLALGAGYRHEKYDLTFGTPRTQAKRDVKYAYAELSVPLVAPGAHQGIQRLEFNVSGRYDRYSDFGGKAVPKVTLTYAPIEDLTFQGTASKAFAAPALGVEYASRYAYELAVPYPPSPTGTSPILAINGGNPQLQAQTATAWNVGFDYKPKWVGEWEVSVSYFDIRYTNRIFHLNDFSSPLTNPGYAPLVTFAPSIQQQQAAIAFATGGFFNYLGVPYDPAAIVALVDARYLNVASQDIDGVDATLDYRHPTRAGVLEVFLNGTFLELRQQLTSTSPQQYLSGTVFNPPRFKARGGTSWTSGPWTLTGTLNYTGRSAGYFFQPSQGMIGSWLTADAQIAFAPRLEGVFHDLRFTLSALNVFDRDPPYIVYDAFRPGYHYDSTNASPIGRTVTLQIAKNW